MHCEDSTGSTVACCPTGELPPTEYSLAKLLDSVALPEDYPTAPVPQNLQTVPKKFQLQVSTFKQPIAVPGTR